MQGEIRPELCLMRNLILFSGQKYFTALTQFKPLFIQNTLVSTTLNFYLSLRYFHIGSDFPFYISSILRSRQKRIIFQGRLAAELRENAKYKGL